MADLEESLVIRVRTDGTLEVQKLTGQLDQLGVAARRAGTTGAASMGQFSGAVGNLAGAFRFLAAGAIGGSVIAAFSSILKAGAEAQETFVHLQTAVEGTGQAFKTVSGQLEGWVQAVDKMSRFDDEGIRRGLTTLIQLGGKAAESEQLLAATADLAVARHMKMEQAAELVGRAMEGQTMALRSAGIIFDDVAQKALKLGTEEERAAILTQHLNDKFGGAAQKDLQTYTGRMEELKNTIQDFREGLGQRFLSNFDRSIAELIERARRAKVDIDAILNRPVAAGFGGRPGGVASVARGEVATAQQRQAIADMQREIGRGMELAIVDGAKKAARPAAQHILKALQDVLGTGSFYNLASNLPTITQRQMEELRKVQEDWLEHADLIFDDMNRGIEEAADEWIAKMRAGWKQILDDASRDFGKRFTEPMTDLFTDLAATGGANFGEIAGRAFQATLEHGAGKLSEIIGNAVLSAFGAQEAPAAGETPEQTTARVRRNATNAQRIGTVFQGVLGGIGGIQANQRGQVNDTQTIMSQIAIGASIGSAWPGLGTAIGAVVGAVIGIISAVASDTAEHYQYASVGFRGGKAYVEAAPGEEHGFQNITPNERQAMLQRMQETFDSFRNSYISIFMQFPDDFRDGLMIALRNIDNLIPRLGLDAGGDIGRSASGHFMEHFDEWVSGRFPRQIAEQFFEPLSQAFEHYGMSTGRFRQIWDQLQALDPKKAVELLGILANAIVGFQETLAYFRTDVFQPMGPGDFAPSAAPSGLLQQAQIRNHESFANALEREDQDIIRLGESLSLLTGEEQIRAAGRLAEMMRARQRSEEEFFQRMSRIIEDVNASLDQFLLGINLEQLVTPEGAPDYQARIGLLQTEGERIWNALTQATTPEEIQHWSQEWMRVNQEILSLAQNLGPQAYQEYLQWVEDNTTAFRETVGERFRQLGQDVQDANDAFLTAIQGFIDAFNDATNAIGGGAGAGGGNESPEPPPPIEIRPDQAAWLESSAGSLDAIELSSAETVALLQELVAARANAEPQTVRLQHSVRVDAPDGYKADVVSRRIDI